ncbi:MAG: enoyl-CoA hydratase-related protein, partial [Candidatus Puniceispirillaceae bacterium]
MTSKQYETIEVERHDKVVLVTLSREPALNALNKQLTDEVIDALSDYDQNPEIGCFVLTG